MRLSHLISIIFAGLPTVSPAAETAPPALEEIVVTAQKRSQNLQEVGIAISAFSGERVDAMNLASSNELARLVPNLNIGEPFGAGNQPAIFLRGIGLADFATNNSGPIGVYVDDLYVSAPSAQVFQAFDLERVEVLRGPQGTLYGRNTTGGAIRYLSAAPTDTPLLRLRGQYGSYDTRKLEAVASGPLSDRLRGRVAVVKDDSDGYLENQLDGSSRNGTDTVAFRGLLEADATARLSIEAAVYGGFVDGPAASYRRQGIMAADGTTPCAPRDVRADRCFDFFGFGAERAFRDVSENRRPTLDVDNLNGRLKLTWQGDGISVTSITGFQSLDKTHEEEADVNPIDWLFVDYEVESDTFTQELQLSGGGARLEWIVGAFYLDETLDQLQHADLGREFRPLIEGVDPVNHPGGFDPDGMALGLPAFHYEMNARQNLESVALFGQVEVPLGPSLDLVAGLRYTDEDKRYRQAPRLVEPGFVIPLYDFDDTAQGDHLSWKLAVEYFPTDRVMTYASVATGFKAGGFNGGFLFDASEQQPYREETITAYEVGLKSTWLDGLLRLNAAAFHNAYDDMQLFRIDAGTGVVPAQVLDNAGKAETTGLELEMALLLAEGLDLALSVGWLDTELTDYVTDLGDDLSGNALAQSPELSAAGTIAYERPLGSVGRLRAHLDVSYQDDVYFTADNNPALAQDGYWLAGARVGLAGLRNGWEVALFATNLLDEEYLVHGFDLGPTQGSNQLMVGRPRTVGIELSYQL